MPFSTRLVDQILQEFQRKERLLLGPFGFSSASAEREINEPKSYRSTFVRDGDRIIHSLSYARYFDKTQVFFWIQSDMHQHRMLHVQLVSKLARVVARILGLNTDLVEAIALGHDIGHPPFGHDGEHILSQICQKNGIGSYHHNYGSVWFLQEIEHQNLSLPVLDGILGHNGEQQVPKISLPQHDILSWHIFYKEMEDLRFDRAVSLQPKTLEGILVRFIDVISYISRDILDAEHLRILSFSDIPDLVKSTLGTSNREIINTLVSDIIINSRNQPYIAYSQEIFHALETLYQFNLKNLYLHQDKKRCLPVLREAYYLLWDHYLSDYLRKDFTSKIFTDHIDLNLRLINTRFPEINNYDAYPYLKKPAEIIIRDFIAGMTDQYFWKLVHDLDPSLEIPYQIIE
ncbi:deoxyguanosinetriphosphate triphosphohydrolase family protein [Candidatus Harpocratesius sp.]